MAREIRGTAPFYLTLSRHFVLLTINGSINCNSTFLPRSLFSETRNIAASPLEASQAYKNIVDSITVANITALAAKDITEDTYHKVGRRRSRHLNAERPE